MSTNGTSRKKVNTWHPGAERVAESVRRKGIAECLTGVAANIHADFLRRHEFDKCARAAAPERTAEVI